MSGRYLSTDCQKNKIKRLDGTETGNLIYISGAKMMNNSTTINQESLSEEFNVNRPFFYKIIFSKQEEEEKAYLYNVPLFMGSFNGSTVTIDI